MRSSRRWTNTSKGVVAAGDETHLAALIAMRGRWKNPIKGMGWYMKTRKDFAALPAGRARREQA